MLQTKCNTSNVVLGQMGWDLLDDTSEERVLAYREGMHMLILRIIMDPFCNTITSLQKKRSKQIKEEALFVKEYEMDLCIAGVSWKQSNYTVMQNDLNYLCSCYSEIGGKIVCVECLMSNQDLLYIFYEYLNKVLGKYLAQLI